MKVAPKGNPKGKTKKCVYCGKNYVIHTNNENTRIIKRLG